MTKHSNPQPTGAPNKNEPHIIVIQGGSCAGKSVFCDYLVRSLQKEKRVVHITMDNFYTGVEFDYTSDKAASYDFDNPAAINWEVFGRALSAYINNEGIIPFSEYSFTAQKRKDVLVENIYPEIIIIEGIYAFNPFNERMFDIERMDPFKHAHENPEDCFIENTMHGEIIGEAKPTIIKILLKMNKDKMRKIRVTRDVANRYKDKSESFRKTLEDRFDRLIWPSTEKWVYNRYSCADYIIENGTFNKGACHTISDRIFDAVGLSSARTEVFIYDKEVENTLVVHGKDWTEANNQ